jgi:hypothetical protein
MNVRAHLEIDSRKSAFVMIWNLYFKISEEKVTQKR